MEYERRIVEAFRTNKITRVLLIDDAYDPPQLPAGKLGQLIDFFESEAGRTVCTELEISGALIASAVAATENNHVDSDALLNVYAALYDAFVRTHEYRYDPTDDFRLTKEPAIAALKPLRSVLKKCGGQVEVRTAGLRDGVDCYREFGPQLVFLDYILDEGSSKHGNAGSFESARRASLNLLSTIVGVSAPADVPAVVLMTSRNVTDVVQYRQEAAHGSIMALRFQFLRKTGIRQVGQAIEIEDAAADALLNISQGYTFGRLVEQALVQWREGAESALNEFAGEMHELEAKDFAYLLRFRLREEGQALSEYLEWMFGECLRGLIDEKVDWKHGAFLRLDREDTDIEGAFDGPSLQIARFYHRVRVHDGHDSNPHRYRLGDLYFELKGGAIRAVITPDCDLILRKRGSKGTGNLLTMGGALSGFNEKGSVADGFLLIDHTPYCVLWNPKDLRTFPTDGEDSLHEGGAFRFLGTLRPLYAQEMQRQALADLSRVGVPVAPALGISATATAWIRTAAGSKSFTQMAVHSPGDATLIPRREGPVDQNRLLLRRPFVNELIEQLRKIASGGHEIPFADLDENDRKALKAALQPKAIGKLYDRFTRDGGLAKNKRQSGIMVGDAPDTRKDAPWLQILVKVSEQAMERLHTVDPLIDFDV